MRIAGKPRDRDQGRGGGGGGGALRRHILMGQADGAEIVRRDRRRAHALALIRLDADTQAMTSDDTTGLQQSSGEERPMPTVPSVVGLSRSAAEQKLTSAGLTTGNVTEAPNPTVAAGIVTGANPQEGTTVGTGSAVNLDLSSGPARVDVPDMVGLVRPAAEQKLRDAGLAVGAVTERSDRTIPAGVVISASPPAGTKVDPGSAVNLDVSNGPPVVVPDVVGLTRGAAQTALIGCGLVVGFVRSRRSDSVPADGVDSTEPQGGTPVQAGSTVNLILSSGPRFNLAQYLPTLLFATLGISVLLLIVYIVAQEEQKFLQRLADKEVARGLITFLIAISTVGIAIILAISTIVLTEGPDGDKRFDRGKQVLSVLIGVLGTIVGFYFGSADSEATKQKQETQLTQKQQAPTQAHITTTRLPNGSLNAAYPATTVSSTGLTAPLTWTVAPALPEGLVLDAAAGTISGAPKVASKQTHKFEVVDSSTPPKSSSANLELEIK